ncbi:MAG: anaerobic glycerol-3-phosphate dehydrogenase subunit C, partial [Planctomycetales bacterium]
EGTLALITEATLRTIPLPKHRAVALLFFDRLETAARSALRLQAFEPSACDLLDRRLLSLARDVDPRYDLLIPTSAEAALLVEQAGDDAREVADRLRQTVSDARGQGLAFDSRQVFEPDEVEFFWRLGRSVVQTLYRLKGSSRAIPFVEDFAVPPEDLPDFVGKIQNILKRRQVTASFFAHAGHGQIHLRPFLDVNRSDDLVTMQSLADDLYQEVIDAGGTISGEHGDGLSRTPFVERQFGELHGVFREIKRIFDPHNIFNPGKIVGDDPDLMTRNLRRVQPRAESEPESSEAGDVPQLVQLQLDWTAAEAAQTARACNGCGLCRSEGPNVRMCPIFRFSPDEAASPRAKANIMRSLLTGALAPDAAAENDFKAVADLCVNCKMCRSECPAGVDIPKLVLEAKAGYVAEHGLRSTDWFLTHLPGLSGWSSLISPVANWVLANPHARWVLEKLLGVAQGRKLPRFASRPFMRRAARRGLTRPARGDGPKVLYFVDMYANYFDPALAEAAVAVLTHNGAAVYVPIQQLPSGMPLISLGAVERARKIARHNVTLLADAIRRGYEVVTHEPSAALCLVEEYPSLLGDDADARLVAEHSFEACAYLWRMHREGTLRLDFQPIAAKLSYHEPCHLRALDVGTPGLNLLRLIPELQVHAKETGCSGMAGTFGLKRENYRSSLRAGWSLITAMRDPDVQGGVTECSACKMQMEQGVRKPTVHPLKLLAHAYGLAPEVAQLLDSRGEELIVT